jgi:N-methylhydantoinase A/oxoprolinase/acetone carboxylase beta subunit
VQVRQNAAPVAAAVWQRGAIRAGDAIPGPAIIEQVDTTILVEPGWTAGLAQDGAALLIRKDPTA